MQSSSELNCGFIDISQFIRSYFQILQSKNDFRDTTCPAKRPKRPQALLHAITPTLPEGGTKYQPACRKSNPAHPCKPAGLYKQVPFFTIKSTTNGRDILFLWLCFIPTPQYQSRTGHSYFESSP